MPGVGNKTAERYAFALLSWKPEELQALGDSLTKLPDSLTFCHSCHSLIESACPYCDLSRRDSERLCIVATPRDVFNIEDTHAFHGLYHVLHGLLSPMDGRHPQNFRLDQLKKRIEDHGVKEIILAVDSTIEGDATALYLKQHLSSLKVSLSRLAFGIPIGSSLDYVDEGTLHQAFQGRSVL